MFHAEKDDAFAFLVKVALDPAHDCPNRLIMFPIRDHNPSSRTPFVTYALMATNIVVFLSSQSIMLDQVATMAFFDTWALRPVEVMAGREPHTIVTSMFLHGGWMHIIGNMLFLWIFGDNLEDEMGHAGFALFYLASGIGAAAAQIAAAPFSQVPMVGASGAIAGVMGGYLLLFPRARVDVLFIIVVFIRIIPIPAWIMLGAWFGLQLFGGFGSDMSGGGVAYWAHAGGFVVGLGLTLPLFIRRGGPAFWARTHGHPPHRPAQYPLQRSNVPKVGRRR